MKRIAFFASFVVALFLLAGASYFFLFHGTKASTVISSVAAQNIMGMGAQIIWTTNVPSDSRVAYVTGASQTSHFSDYRCDSGGYVTAHCVNLTGLAISTVYYYKVESMDTSGVDSVLEGFQFTSAAGDTHTGSIPSAAPSNLAVSLSANGADATFTWTDNTFNESAFKIFRRSQGDIGWNYLMPVDMNITSLVYPSIPFGTYEYYVSACNAFGCSPNSNIVSVTRSSTLDTTSPSVPQNVKAAAFSSSQINLSWTASTDNVGVTGYNIYRDSAFLANVASLSYSDTALSTGTLYSYAVAAVDGAKNFSLASPAVKATTLLDALPPVISYLGVKNIIGPGAQIVWNTDSPASSKAFYGTTSGSYLLASTWSCDAGGNVTNHCVNLADLVSGTRYYYQVSSINSAGYETKSAEQTFFSASSTQVILATVATTTTTALTPITVSAKTGNSYCLSGFSVANVSFLSSPAGSSYFSLSGGRLSSPQNFNDGSGNVMPYGDYAWKAIPKTGYSITGSASGTFNIPSLDSCSSVASTIATPLTANTATTVQENTRAYIALWKGDIPVGSGQSVQGEIKINIGVEGADSVSLYEKSNNSSEPKLLGAAIRATDKPSLWRFLWDSKTVPDGSVTIFSRVKNSAGEYTGDSVSTVIKNGAVGSTAPSATYPAAASIVNELLARPENIEVAKAFLGQKIDKFLETHSVEEKQRAAEKIRKDLGLDVLVRDTGSVEVQVGTTTISRQEEPARVVEEISQMIKNRADASVLKDTDKDGISDYDETYIYGTDPNKADTDGDGVNDGEEILLGMNPIKKEFALVPHENPKDITVAAKASPKEFSVTKVELIPSPVTAMVGTTTKKYVTFEGTALPNSFILVYIFSTPVVVTVKTDNDGKWTYTMDKELEDGNHEVYVAMTESAGKIIVKSDPIPFVKTAQAATLQSNFALAADTSEGTKGFFRGGTLALSLMILFIILGLSFLVISFVSKKKESADE